ncbi:tRNA-dihydrouridine synthase family protein [bacterium]|nr:tRNA-dihydrouridine synthase family protein [bacterium]
MPTAKRRKKGSDEGAVLERSQRPPPPHRYVCAPMVGGSELAFRLLCRRYATRRLLCYTPMMSSERFASEPSYRAEIFQSCAEDRPLVAHFAGNDPAVMLAAAKLVEDCVDAVDLNLGCPQRIAHSGHFGSFLLDEADRTLVCSIVRALAGGLTVPVHCKVRLLSTTEETVALCCQLRDAGASLIAVHARHRVSLVGRSGPVARDGPALLDEVAAVCTRVKGVRIVANGNVITWDDVCANLQTTGAHGIMSAEGLLDDPALFLPSITEDANGLDTDARAQASGGAAALREEKRLLKKLREIERLRTKEVLSTEEQAKVARRGHVRKQLKRCRTAATEARGEASVEDATEVTVPPVARIVAPPKPSPLSLATEYLDLTQQHPEGAPLRTVVFHVRRIAKRALTEYQLMAEMLEAKDVPTVRSLVEKCVWYEVHGYKPDPDKAKREREAIELKKWRESTRKRCALAPRANL